MSGTPPVVAVCVLTVEVRPPPERTFITMAVGHDVLLRPGGGRRRGFLTTEDALEAVGEFLRSASLDRNGARHDLA